MNLPGHILLLMDRLEEKNFQAWAVGGCVRDALLGKQPQDYDLCTDALPEQTRELFGDFPLVLAGMKHGTVGVVTQAGVVEITTFRTEGDYGDCRHPGWVRFVPTLRQDLARRDFTVNAMAYNPKQGLCDPFGGRQDLVTGTLRAVGEPEKRFREDALRILRGVRFSVTYRLTPEKETERAMLSLAPALESLARERVFAELSKLLPPAKAEDFLRFKPVLTGAVEEFSNFSETSRLPEDLPLRLAALLARGDARKAMTGLKAPAALTGEVCFFAENLDISLENPWELVAQYGKSQILRLLLLRQAFGLDPGPTQWESIPDVTLKNLAVSGKDLLELGYTPGKELGNVLKELLFAVLQNRVPNEKPALLSLLSHPVFPKV